MQEEHPLQVARCTKIINALPSATTTTAPTNPVTVNPLASLFGQNNTNNTADQTKYLISIKQIAKFVVGLGEKVSPTDIDEGMRVGVDRVKYAIQLPLPPRIDPTVSLMEVEDKPDVTYDDVGGSRKALEQLREVVEIPLLYPERFVTLGIDPPKGVLLYGPPGIVYHLSYILKVIINI